MPCLQWLVPCAAGVMRLPTAHSDPGSSDRRDKIVGRVEAE
jgi:hypothetical protein